MKTATGLVLILDGICDPPLHGVLLSTQHHRHPCRFIVRLIAHTESGLLGRGKTPAYPICIKNVSSPDTFRNMIRVRYMYDTLVIDTVSISLDGIHLRYIHDTCVIQLRCRIMGQTCDTCAIRS